VLNCTEGVFSGLSGGLWSPSASSLVFNLLQEFEIQTIQLWMGESPRPRQMAVYKSGSLGGFDQLVPWLYLVTVQSECRSEFSVPANSVPDSADAVLCQPYPTVAAEINEQVRFRSPAPPALPPPP